MSAADTAAPVKLAGYFLEWQRIEDEKAELAEQSKDLFKAMKDEGWNTKAARASFREKRVELGATAEDVAKTEEAEAILDLYRSALTNGLAARAHPAHSARENIEEFASQSRPVNPAQEPTDYAARSGDKSAATNSPETANEVPAQDGGGTATGESPSGKSNAAHPVSEQELADADLNDGTAAGETAIEVVTGGESATADGRGVEATVEQRPSAIDFTDEPDDAADASGDYLREPATAASGQIIREGDAPRETGRFGGDASCPDTNFEPPAFLARQKTMADYRPNCLNPDVCASDKLDHCRACKRALEAAQAESEAA